MAPQARTGGRLGAQPGGERLAGAERERSSIDSVRPSRGLLAKGRSYELVAMEWFAFRDGLFHRRWRARDFASQSRQLGFSQS
jgi:hypothetical protein